jgi:hypothetical protein
MKIGLFTLGVAILLIGLAKFGTSIQTETASPRVSEPVVESVASVGSIDIVQNNIDLGDIPIRGGKVNATFRIANMGNEAVRLTEGKTSCMCTEAVVETANGEVSPKIQMPGHGSSSIIDMVVASGEEANVIATFDPMAHGPNALGPITRDVMLTTNSKTNPQVRLTFRGNVVKE